MSFKLCIPTLSDEPIDSPEAAAQLLRKNSSVCYAQQN